MAGQGHHRGQVHQRPRLQPDRLPRFRAGTPYRLRAGRIANDPRRTDVELGEREDRQPRRGRALRADVVVPVGLDDAERGRRQPPGHRRLRQRRTAVPRTEQQARLRGARRIVPASDEPRTGPEPPRTPGPGRHLPSRRYDARALRRLTRRQGHWWAPHLRRRTETRPDETIWFAVAGSDAGPQAAQRDYDRALKDPEKLLQAKATARQQIDQMSAVDLPGDRLLQQSVEWSKQN